MTSPALTLRYESKERSVKHAPVSGRNRRAAVQTEGERERQSETKRESVAARNGEPTVDAHAWKSAAKVW